MAIKDKTILISGATGFIGANLVHRAIELGNKPHIILRKESNTWRIQNIMKDLVPHYLDLQNADETSYIIKEIRPQIVFHTAVYGGYPFQQDADKIVNVNFVGTVNLLNACRNAGFDLFVNTGSSSEYGAKSKAMNESNVLEPLNEYGAAKAAATLYCQAIAKKENRPIVTLRLFSPYGYWEDPARLIPSVITSCLKKKDPEVSSPDSLRDFVFIEDVQAAYFKTIENKDKISGEIINIGSGKQQSVKTVVDLIVKMTGSGTNPEWNKIHNPRIELKFWQADISKAKKVLHWSPKHSLKQGLEKTIEWFRQSRNFYE